MSDQPARPADAPLRRGPLKAATRLVANGRPQHVPDAPLNVPVAFTSTYVAGGAVEYGRYGNPTWTALEETIGDLESGRCLTFASGMAAVSCILDLVAHGDTVVAPRHAYNGAVMALAELEARGRIKAELVDITDTEAVRAACDEAAILWLESPTNPALEVIDLAELIEVGHQAGATVVVDNTFATPLFQRPLELGADVVVHSGTKYLSGHSDVLLGAVITASDELYAVFKGRRDLTGAVPGPMEAFLSLRGLRTMHLRVERATSNATELARRLAAHPAIEEVRYPGFGGIIAAVVAGGADRADVMVRATQLWVHSTSLGGVESQLERRRRWKAEPVTIPEGLVRLSVGIEDVDDLWADLDQALALASR